MFQRFEQAVSELTRGTVGTFCMRCHAPVATQLQHPREASIFDGPTVFREGITCVACHRVAERYGRVNGERRIEPGNIFDPVVGNSGGDGIERVLADPDHYKVKTDPNDKRPLQNMHRGAIQFEQLSDSSFCGWLPSSRRPTGHWFGDRLPTVSSRPRMQEGGLLPRLPYGHSPRQSVGLSNLPDC